MFEGFFYVLLHTGWWQMVINELKMVRIRLVCLMSASTKYYLSVLSC